MQDPRARVFRAETEGHIVARITRGNDVTTDLQINGKSDKVDYFSCGTTHWIFVVIDRASSTSDDIEGMLQRKMYQSE